MKTLLVYLLSLSLALSPAMAAENEPQMGQWPDGTALVYQCSKNAVGSLKIAVRTKDGSVYQAVLSCGERT